MFTRLFCLLSLFLWGGMLSLWANSTIDSLLYQLENKKEITIERQVDLLTQVSWEYRRSDATTMLRYAREALKLSEKHKYVKGFANANKNIGIAWNIQGESDSAVYYMNQALFAAETLDDKHLILRNLNNLGLIHQRLGNYEVALEYYQQSAQLSEYLGDELFGVILMNLGFLQQKLKDYNKALEYYRRALNLAETQENSIRISSCLYNIGGIYRAKEQVDISKQYYKRALRIAERNTDNLLICKTLNSLGRVCIMQKKWDKALDYFEKGRTIAVLAKDQETILQSDLECARILHQQNKFNDAYALASQGLILAQKILSKKEEINFLKLLSEIEKKRGNIAAAHLHLEQYLNISEELFNEEKARRIHALETNHQIQQQEAEVALLLAQTQEQDAIIRRQTTELSAVLVGVLLLSFIAVMLYRVNLMRREHTILLEQKVEERTHELQLTNQQLKNSNQELERFAYITSHDLKEPLRNISGFTRLLERKLHYQLDDEARTFLKFVMKNARQMHRLIEDVLEYTKIGQETAEFEVVELDDTLRLIHQQMAAQIKEKNATVRFSKMPHVMGQKAHLYLIFSNLIENALKFNQSENPFVHVSCQRKGNNWQFKIKDNGIGIAEEFQFQIFQMFKRLHNRADYEGSGMGLALVKKLVEQHKGQIWVQSKVGKGSTFYFSLAAVRKDPSHAPVDAVLVGN